MTDRFDVVVVGGGPGGYAAALYGAAAGLRIAVVEADTVGGTCLNRGCIPAKELLQTAEVARTVRGAGEFGVLAESGGIDWPTSITRQAAVVDRLVKGLAGLMKRRKVEVFAGRGRLVAPDAVEVTAADGTVTRVEGEAVVLATGSEPVVIPGFAPTRTGDGMPQVATSDEALFLPRLPASVAIVGGGVIGCEFASTFVDVGVDVLVLEMADALIPGADADLAKFLQTELTKRGVQFKLGARVTGQHSADDGGDLVTIAFEHEGEELEADVEMILVAVGRRPRTADIGCEDVGVARDDRGFVTVDPAMRTSVPGVYAVGDIVATPALAHVAYAEAMVAVRDILGEPPLPVDYDRVPWCVYTHPEVAWCGWTEEQAKAHGHEVTVSKHSYAGVGRAIILGETKGFVKIVTDAASGQILGFHITGPWATEQLTEGYLATNWEATVGELGHLTHAHPTLSEAIGEAALSMTGRGLHG